MNVDRLDATVLDRLVDGELSEEQQRDVLVLLDEIQDGWKRCALAFLEAQCWQRAMQPFDQQAVPHTGTSSQTIPKSTTGPGVGQATTNEALHQSYRGAGADSQRRWTWVLALTAVFLLAFGIGRLVPSARNQMPSTTPGTSPRPIVKRPAQQAAESPKLLADQAESHDVPNRPIGSITMVDDAGQQVDVPVYNWSRQVADRLLYHPKPLPSGLLDNLKRHSVRQYQRYLPVALDDGRHVVVPVQEVDIVPVAGVVY